MRDSQETLANCPQMGFWLGFPFEPGHESNKYSEAAAIYE